MRGTGLRASRLGILVAPAVAEEATVSKLAGLLDRTTMTRSSARSSGKAWWRARTATLATGPSA